MLLGEVGAVCGVADVCGEAAVVQPGASSARGGPGVGVVLGVLVLVLVVVVLMLRSGRAEWLVLVVLVLMLLVEVLLLGVLGWAQLNRRRVLLVV